jgi:hypothetical protein
MANNVKMGLNGWSEAQAFPRFHSASDILRVTRARLQKQCVEMGFSATRRGDVWLAKTKMTNVKSASEWRLLSMRMVPESKC